MFDSLIDAESLYERLADQDLIIIDCRFSLEDGELGYRQYLNGHIPGAQYAHLDNELSGPITAESGRHPLPPVGDFKQTLSKWGINAGSQVVAYDENDGMLASRLWWMLLALGHQKAAVLNGGFANWRSKGYPIETAIQPRDPSSFSGYEAFNGLIGAQEILEDLEKGKFLVVDSRAPERYSGAEEPLDAVAGHIPCAINKPYPENMGSDGLFKSKEALKKVFLELHKGHDPNSIVYYCGSGVSANHNLLAMRYAGLPIAKLYAGSWSEWIRDPHRPIELGN